jgi:NitT/TauT family transport system permease protein
MSTPTMASGAMQPDRGVTSKRLFRLPTPGAKAVGAASVLGGLALWEIVGRYFLADSIFFVPFSEVLVKLQEWAESGRLTTDIRVTATEFLLGFFVAAGLGIPFGFLLGVNRLSHRVFNPWVSALYATPLVVLMPFYFLVFGTGVTSKAALTATVAIFPIIISTAAGAAATEREKLEVAEAFSASPLQRLIKVVVPSSVPFIISGLRLGVGRGLTGVVVAEFFFSEAGIGNKIATAGQSFDTGSLFAGVIIFALAGVLLMGLFTWLERRVSPWRA